MMDGEIKSDDPSELAFSQEELEFLKESLENVNILDGYCYGFHDFDNIAALEDFLENYQMISSTGFVHEESHSREKQHKRYSATASPVFESSRGNVPISFLGHPFMIMSNETRNCLHGPVKADIFPETGGRTFYQEAILSSKGIPVICMVAGSCTAGAAYVPTMADEAVIVDKIGTIFLGGPPLVKAATGEVVSAEDLGGAMLHSSISGCTDHFGEDEEKAIEMTQQIIATLNQPETPAPKGPIEPPLYNVDDLLGLSMIDCKDLPMYQVQLKDAV
ncbi:hypothetical protein QZH41_018225 [Actinostola sp. cb2023]|nr:hypothetical protein QZH41_018225 [Actinostola sp. cb2023]